MGIQTDPGSGPIADDEHCTNGSTRVERKWFPGASGQAASGSRYYHNAMNEPRSIPDWRPLALTIAGLTAAYAIAYRLMPMDMRGYFLWPFGAWAMYCGARLTTRVAIPVVLGGFLLSEIVLYKGSYIPPNYLYYLCLGVSMLIGRVFLVRSQAVWRIVLGGFASYAFFFLASNFASWLEPAREYYRPYSLETLLLCYREGLEFLRYFPGHIVGLGDVLPGLFLFGAHAVLAKLYFPAERVVAETAQ
jgi:hypothetical protein